MQVVALYAGVLALMFVLLSLRTLSLRRALRIPVGDGGSLLLLRAMRAHANFAEYVPIALILMYLLEDSGASGASLHALGICLVVGRLLHALALGRLHEPALLRVGGMVLTFVPIVAAAVRLLAFAF